MKSKFFYTLSSVALSAAIVALAAPASAQGRRPGGHGSGSGSDRPRSTMQAPASSTNRSATASSRPQASPSSNSRSATQGAKSSSNNRPSYSAPGGDNNRPRGGGNHGGANTGGGRNNGGNNGGVNNKGSYNQRPNATTSRPENNNKYTNSRINQPNQQTNKDYNGFSSKPGDNGKPGGMKPGDNGHGGNHGGGNYRPGGNNSNHGGNYRPGDNGSGNQRPGGGNGYNRPPAGGPHHGGINHGGPRPDYNRYRWNSDVRPRGPRDRWYDHYRYNRWSWHAPIAPPFRQWRPRIVWYYRPIIPTGYRYYASAPIISGVLGVEFGTYLDASLNYLYYNGYDIDGYQDNVVYLRNVNMMGYSWPDVMLQYDNNGGMCYAEFVTSASYQDDYRYRSIYNSLCNSFGTPINSGNGHFSWYGRNGGGFVNLNTVYESGRYFTVLTFGV